MKTYKDLRKDIDKILESLSPEVREEVIVYACDSRNGKVALDNVAEIYSLRIRSKREKEGPGMAVQTIKDALDELGYSVATDTLVRPMAYEGGFIRQYWTGSPGTIIPKGRLYIRVYSESVVDTDDLPFMR